MGWVQNEGNIEESSLYNDDDAGRAMGWLLGWLNKISLLKQSIPFWYSK